MFTFSVTDTIGSYASYIDDIIVVAAAAGETWESHFFYSADIEVSILIEHTPSGTANATSASSGNVGTFNGLDLWQEGVAYEVQTGIDPNGASADAIIRIDPDYLVGELWFDPTPLVDNGDIPSTKTDAFSVLLHEIGHALGFNGWRDWSTGALPGGYLSAYDQHVVMNGGFPYFTGDFATSIYGNAVPLTTGNLMHYGNGSGPGSDLVADGLMNGVVYFRGTRYEIADIDLAILQDTGLDVYKTYTGGSGPDSVVGNVLALKAAGGAGSDTIRGGSNNDQLMGDAGGDTINGDGGNDWIWGGADADSLGGDAGSDTIDGGDGNDWIWGGSDADTIGGNVGDDVIFGEDGDDWIYGNAGNDTLNGNAGNDRLFAIDGLDALGGGSGADTLYSGYNYDWMWGGADADKFHFAGWSWHDFLMDFEDGLDKIDLTGEGWDYTQASQISIVDDANGDAFISLGYNTWITIVGVSASQLSNADFNF